MVVAAATEGEVGMVMIDMAVAMIKEEGVVAIVTMIEGEEEEDMTGTTVEGEVREVVTVTEAHPVVNHVRGQHSNLGIGIAELVNLITLEGALNASDVVLQRQSNTL